MKRIHFFLILLLLTVSFQQCDKKFSGARYDSNDRLQIMDYIDSREDLSIYKELIDYVGQRSLLKTAGTYTAFIPNNEAFGRLFASLSVKGKRITSIRDMEPAYWLNYFRYHLLDRKINTNEFEHGPLPYFTSYNNKYMVADVSETYAAIKLNNLATIREYNIEFANGYVNIIDEVIIPPLNSVYDAIVESGKYNTMLNIFEELGYTKYLKDSAITLLIESDEALAKSNFSREAIPDIDEWAKYHIIPDSAYFLNMLTAQRIYPLYDKESLSFNVDAYGQYFINNHFPFNQSREYGIDKVNSNGIYHTLDTLLVITESVPAKIRFNLYPPGSPHGGQNIFAEAPARILLNTGTQSYHQNRELKIVQFDARQVGDYFWLTVPDVPRGNYRIRIIHRAAAMRGKFLTIYNNQIIKENINMAVSDGTFEEYNYFIFNYCGDITVDERSDVKLYFVFSDFGSNKNPGYCCDLLPDILELIPITN